MSELSTRETNPLVDYTYSYTPQELKTLTFAETVAKVRQKVAPYRFKLAARAITRELEMKGGEKVLELGSGLGILGKSIKEEVDGEIFYTGVELAYSPANESKKANIEPTQGSVTDLPFPDNSFDSVVSTDVLEHVPNSQKAVGELARVLKPGGKAFFVIADPSEARFDFVHDHIDRTHEGTDTNYWQKLFEDQGLRMNRGSSEKYRKKDWRKIFNLPYLVKLKDKPGFACAFNPVNRPGTYILEKPPEKTGDREK
jgi:ubiquinone/menaquinone biosynthesis C-methylase UbiE